MGRVFGDSGVLGSVPAGSCCDPMVIELPACCPGTDLWARVTAEGAGTPAWPPPFTPSGGTVSLCMEPPPPQLGDGWRELFISAWVRLDGLSLSPWHPQYADKAGDCHTWTARRPDAHKLVLPAIRLQGHIFVTVFLGRSGGSVRVAGPGPTSGREEVLGLQATLQRARRTLIFPASEGVSSGPSSLGLPSLSATVLGRGVRALCS